MSQREVTDRLATLDTALRERLPWYPIAKKEFKDTLRTKTTVVLWVLFLAMYPLPAVGLLYVDLGATRALSALVGSQAAAFSSVLVPVAALGVTYSAVSAEHERGSLKLLLSLPYTRSDLVLGKTVGRAVAVSIPLVVSIALRTVVFLSKPPKGLQAGTLVSQSVATIALTVLLAVAFVAVGVGISAASRSTRWATAGAFGLYLYLFLFWNALANGLASLLKQYADISDVAGAYLTLSVKLLNPTQAYKTLLNTVGGTSQATARMSIFARRYRQSGCEQIFGGTWKQGLLGGQCDVAGGSVPVYFSDAAVVVLLVLWVVVPLYLGYTVFADKDL